jgi:hypothetical protein
MKNGYHDHFCHKCGHGFICHKVTHCNEAFDALCLDHKVAGRVMMITVCEKCEEGFERDPDMTMCADCCATYHQRCFDALEKCPVCAERYEHQARMERENG